MSQAPFENLGETNGGTSKKFRRLAALVDTFRLSVGEIARNSGRAISKTQVHRILTGKTPSPAERQAIAAGVMASLRTRCDSSFLFEE